jgi:hypothetical protein
MGTYIIGGLLIAALAGIVVKMIKDRKKGCGCGCGSCPYAQGCKMPEKESCSTQKKDAA